MEEEDEFGDLSADIGQEAVKIHGKGPPGLGPLFYSDEDDEETPHDSSTQSQVKLGIVASQFVIKSSIDRIVDQDSEEDEELLLFGRRNVLADNKYTESSENQGFVYPQLKIHGTDTELLDTETEEVGGIPGKAPKEDVERLAAPVVETKEKFQSFLANNSASIRPVLQKQEGHLHVDDLTAHTVAIPGLFTNPSIPVFVADDDGDQIGQDWVERETTRHNSTGQETLTGEAVWDSDSEDGLQIVLNDDHPMYSSFEKGAEKKIDDDSDDEDDEDLVIVTGGEPIEDQEWGEEHSVALDGVQGGTSDRSLALVGDKLADDKEQLGKGGLSVGLNQGVGRMSYGYHHSQFKYVRPGATSGTAIASAGQLPGSRATLSKGVTGRSEWSGSGRGSYSHRISQGLWGVGTARGFQYGYEFTLPPTKTVFDIELDSLEEKPWRHPGIDITDFFNFGFNESSWKDYCKKLAQLHLESTMQSKIRVYESGRSEREYDPDLPPELAAATGVHGAPKDSTQQGHPETDTMTTAGHGRGAARGYPQMIPIGRAIQVEGGAGERPPSADVRWQRFRDSDAILLHDVEEEPAKGAVGNTEVLEDDEEEGEEDVEGEHEEEGEHQQELEVGPTSEPKPHKNLWDEAELPSGENESRSMKAGLSPIVMAQEDRRPGPESRMDVDNLKAFPMGAPSPDVEAGQAESGLRTFSDGSFVPSIDRDEIAVSSTPIRTPNQEKQDVAFMQSHTGGTHQESGCKRVSDKYDGYLKGCIDNTEPKITQEVLDSDKIGMGQMLEEASTSQGLDVHERSNSREILLQDGGLKYLQGGDHLHSLKIQRLSSHDESHTASKEDSDLARPARNISSDVSADYSKERFQIEREASHRKEHKRHRSMSREDINPQHEDDNFHERKNFILHRRQKMGRDAVSHLETLRESSRYVKGDNKEKGRLTEQFMDMHDKQDHVFGRRKEKDDRRSKRDTIENTATKHKNTGPVVDSSDSRRKRVEDGRKERLERERALREKDREVRLTSRRSIENEMTFRRNREEETRRWSRPEKKGVGCEREIRGTDRHDYEQGVHSRRREKVDGRQKWKGRDNSRREKDDTQVGSRMFQDTNGRRDKNEEREGQFVRSSQQSEEKTWLGEENHGKEGSRICGSDKDGSRERRKNEEVYKGDRDRLEDFRHSDRPYRNRQGSQFLEHVSNGMQNLHHEHSVARVPDKQRVQNDRCKVALARNKRAGIGRKGSASALEEANNYRNFSDMTKKRRTSDHETIHHLSNVPRKTSERAGSASKEANFKVTRQQRRSAHVRENNDSGQNYSGIKERSHIAYSDSSEDCDPKHWGRSKLERWTSQKERITDTSLDLIVEEKRSEMAVALHNTLDKYRQDNISGSWRDGFKGGNDDSGPDSLYIVETVKTSRKEQQNRISEDNEQDEKQGGAGSKHVIVVNNVDAKDVDEELQGFQQPIKQQYLDIAAKLEKRKERFKLSMTEDKELCRKSEVENNQQSDRAEVKAERPARKRRWGSG